MVTTPLITKIKSSGGTLYTFTSTSKDLTKVATNNSTYKFKFSHFACLNLPYIMEGSNTTYVNYTFDANEHKTIDYIKSHISDNKFYIEIKLKDEEYTNNTTCFIIFNDKKYSCTSKNGIYNVNISIDKSLIHSIFKFRVEIYENNKPSTETIIDKLELTYNGYVVGNDMEKGLYLEQFNGYKFSTNDYNISMAEQFQNYILNFESVILNSKDFNSNSLKSPAERIFFNWLRKVGGIRFNKNIENEKYNTDRTVQYLGDIDVINQVNINGDAFGEVYLYIPSNVGATPTIKFKTITDSNYKQDTYKYGSEIICGRDNFKEEDKPIDDISLKAIFDGDEGGNFYLGDEGYCIDFSDPEQIRIDNSESYENFEFNCVLIYYDLMNNVTKESQTNLYGVLFLDNFKSNNINTTGKYLAYIDPLPKLRSSELDDGNSFALKLDLKFDTAPSTTMTNQSIETYEDPNKVDGYSLYFQALTQLQKCIDTFYTQQHDIYRLQDRINDIESIIINQPNISEVEYKIENLRSKLDSLSINNLNDMSQKINEIEDKLKNIYFKEIKGIEFGSGLDTTTNYINDTVVNNTLQNYNYVGCVSLNTDIEGDYIYIKDNSINFDLLEYTNLILMCENESDDSDVSLYENLTININVKNINWEKGQSIKFVANDNFKFNDIRHENLILQTTIDDKIIKIKTFNKDDIDRMEFKNELEIICINNDFKTENYKFITVLR